MTISIRPATAADLPLIAQLIRDLAEYERLAHEVRFDDDVLNDDELDVKKALSEDQRPPPPPAESP